MLALWASWSWSSRLLALTCPQQKKTDQYPTEKLFNVPPPPRFMQHIIHVIHIHAKKAASLWNAPHTEGVVVPATIDQSMPRFDKRQKQEPGHECVCVCVFPSYTVWQHCIVVCSVVGWPTEGKWELWKLCWRNAAGKLKVCENVLEKVEIRGGGEGQAENVHWNDCKKKKGGALGKSKRQKMRGETSLRWQDERENKRK